MLRPALFALLAAAIAWMAFVGFLAVARPDTTSIKDTLRLLPDTVRLIRSLATDRTIPRTARIPVWLLLAYLAIPIDLVPDFIPVLGYADDVILVAFVLRRLARIAGPQKLDEHWPGNKDGLESLTRLLRLT